MAEKIGAVLVVGGGVSGIQSSLDLADSGYKVYLVDDKPSIGGVMAQLDKTFPTNDCAMCILAPKLVAAGSHQNIELMTHTEVAGVNGQVGDFRVKLLRKARSVDMEKCTGCGMCQDACPVRCVIQVPEPSKELPVCRDQAEIDGFLEARSNFPQPLIQVLLDVNERYRYLPKDVLVYLSAKMDIPMSRIYQVVTFYKAFSLVAKGKYHLRSCQGTACHVRGSRKVIEHIRDIIATSPEGLFSVEIVNCMGTCAFGPVIMLNDEYHGEMSPKKLDDLLQPLREEAIAELEGSEPEAEGKPLEPVIPDVGGGSGNSFTPGGGHDE